MKTFKDYLITKAKNFRFTQEEREALANFVGIICGDLGDDDDFENVDLIIQNLTQAEIEELSNLYNYCLDDEQTYSYVNRTMIIDEIPLLKKIYHIIEKNDLFGEQWDLMDAFDKIIE